eukprot:6745299-Alexandrium_andersonii.AAC.1
MTAGRLPYAGRGVSRHTQPNRRIRRGGRERGIILVRSDKNRRSARIRRRRGAAARATSHQAGLDAARRS